MNNNNNKRNNKYIIMKKTTNKQIITTTNKCTRHTGAHRNGGRSSGDIRICIIRILQHTTHNTHTHTHKNITCRRTKVKGVKIVEEGKTIMKVSY